MGRRKLQEFMHEDHSIALSECILYYKQKCLITTHSEAAALEKYTWSWPCWARELSCIKMTYSLDLLSSCLSRHTQGWMEFLRLKPACQWSLYMPVKPTTEFQFHSEWICTESGFHFHQCQYDKFPRLRFPSCWTCCSCFIFSCVRWSRKTFQSFHWLSALVKA